MASCDTDSGRSSWEGLETGTVEETAGNDCRIDYTALLVENDRYRQAVEDRNEVIAKLLVDKCKLEQLESNRSIDLNCSRLGHFVEDGEKKWLPGQAFAKLEEKLKAMSKQKLDIEMKIKEISRRRTTTKPGKSAKRRLSVAVASSPSSPSTPSRQSDNECAQRFQLALLKKEEFLILQDLAVLERERDRHLMDLKMRKQKEEARYFDHPILGGRYLLLDLIGKGGFSEVYQGFDINELRDVTCKIHQFKSEWGNSRKASYLKHTIREKKIQEELDHPNIIRLFDAFKIDANTFCTVMEFCSGSDLECLLRVHKMFPEKEAKLILVQLMSGLVYLNELQCPIIHYDLKPGNILVCDGCVKIIDFGLSKIVDDDVGAELGIDLTTPGAGTFWYLPPECFLALDSVKISSKVDVWSVGVIFYQLLYGKKKTKSKKKIICIDLAGPFGQNLGSREVYHQLTVLAAAAVDFPAKPTVSTEGKGFITTCLTYKQEMRPTILQLAQHDYVKVSVTEQSGSTLP